MRAPVLATLGTLLVSNAVAAQDGGWRTIGFQTTEVTAPDVAVSPDGRLLVFTMLGKLFRLPVRGGEAEQLTFGPWFDRAPRFSPDGRVIAFQSDRDSSAGNIFLLDLSSKAVTQLTREPWADRPTWAPDGRSVVYLRLEREHWDPVDSVPRPPSLLRRIAVTGGEPETLRPIGDVWSAFHLADGRLGWTVVSRDSASRRVSTGIEVREADGNVTTRILDGTADQAVAGAAGGIYARYIRWDPRSPGTDPEVRFIPLPSGPERRLAAFSGERTMFAVAGDSSLYLGNLGHLWRISIPDGQREHIPFRARVTLVVREHQPPRPWTPVRAGALAPARTVSQPRLSPDGSRIVFRALNRLWHQSGNGQARRVVADTAGTERDPAFSPDGRQLAFVRNQQDRWSIQILDLRSNRTRTVGPAAECAYEYLTWSRHGELVAATGCRHQHRVVAIDPTTGVVRPLAETSRHEPWPQLSADGQTLFFQADFTDAEPSYYRLRLVPAGRPEPLFQLPAGADEGVGIWTNERWIASQEQNRPEIRLALLGATGVAPSGGRVVPSSDGGEFSTSADGSHLIHVEGLTVWSEPLSGGRRVAIPIRLELRPPSPPPLLLRRVRVLDFASGSFGAETSLLLDSGRISWIGDADARELPPGTPTVDAAGRFAIPGLFDMHGHGRGCGGARYISYGITSVRNMGGLLQFQLGAGDRSDLTGDPLPRCFFAGRILEGPHGASRNENWYFIHVGDEADMRHQVRRLEAQGARFIKLYNMVPWPLQRAAADEAYRAGLAVEAHGSSHEQVVKGVALGFGGLTHWRAYYEDVQLMMAAAGTHWEPTTMWILGGDLHFREQPDRFVEAARSPWRLAPDNFTRGAWAEFLGTLGEAHRRGIPFLPGTDGGPGGLALQWELEALAEAGIPPLEVLRLATLASAQALGAEAHLGSLEVGKLADLILLDADPLLEIRNTQAIWRVFKGGWMFDPAVLRPPTP